MLNSSLIAYFFKFIVSESRDIQGCQYARLANRRLIRLIYSILERWQSIELDTVYGLTLLNIVGLINLAYQFRRKSPLIHPIPGQRCLINQSIPFHRYTGNPLDILFTPAQALCSLACPQTVEGL